MADFSEAGATETVIESLAGCADARLRQIMASVIRHLHAVVREVEPTPAEWMAAIDFLTRTGQACTATRQEFIMLSDTLGVSMLVDAIANRREAGCTESTVLGPFHLADAPEEPGGASISRDRAPDTLVEGHVLDPAGHPVAGALLDVWQASPEGFYDVQQPGTQPPMNLRGRFRTGVDGAFRFRTLRPAGYPIPTDGPVGEMLRALGRPPQRPAHIHLIASAPGYRAVVTHIFDADDPALGSDAVFGVKASLVRRFEAVDDPEEAARSGLPLPFWRVDFDVVLEPEPSQGGQAPPQ